MPNFIEIFSNLFTDYASLSYISQLLYGNLYLPFQSKNVYISSVDLKLSHLQINCLNMLPVLQLFI